MENCDSKHKININTAITILVTIISCSIAIGVWKNSVDALEKGQDKFDTRLTKIEENYSIIREDLGKIKGKLGIGN